MWIGGYAGSGGSDIWLDGTTVDLGQLQVYGLDYNTHLLLECAVDWKLADLPPNHTGRVLCEML